MTQARDVADGKFTNTTLTIDSGSDNANTLLLSDGAADANIVDGFVTCRHHSSSEEPVLMIQGRSTSSENIVLVGGTHNNSTYNTATSIKFFTASGYTNTTPVEKMRVTGDGLTFNGDTAAANALNDYEEGSFTPTVTDTSGNTGSTSESTGYYRKIGGLVHVELRLTNINTSGLTGSDDVKVASLPFTHSARSGTVQAIIANIYQNNINLDYTGVLIGILGENQDSFAIVELRDSAGDHDLLVSDLISGSADLLISATYHTEQ